MFVLPESPDRSSIITVSPSQLNTWYSCNYKWYLTQIGGFTAGTNFYMRRGSTIHTMFQKFYDLFIGRPVEPVDYSEVMKIYTEMQPEYSDISDLAMFTWAWTTFNRYVDWAYQNDDFVPLATEVELFAPTDLEFNGKQVYLHGILDLLLDRAGEIGIMDHKSYDNEGNKWTPDMVYFDQQLSFYALMVHLLGYSPKFCVINGINVYPYKKQVLDDQLFSREEVSHPPKRLMRYRDNIYKTIRKMYQSDDYPKHLDKSCGRCGYREVCDAEMRGLDSKAILLTNHRRDRPQLTAELPLEVLEQLN